MIEVFEKNGVVQYKRWNIHQRIQHFLMLVTMIVCVFTGFPIKYHQQAWAQSFVDFFGGFDTMLNWHLVSAAGIGFYMVYHLIWQLGSAIKGTAGWGIVPRASTGRHLVQNIKYLLGKADEPPKFDRYTYKEMFDYWAVGWGIIAIGLTGLIMWFPEWSASFLPRWVVDCCRVAHSDEAVLAAYVIGIWHFYNVHFSPDFFPMSSVWYDGCMTEEVMAHEHGAELEEIKKAMAGKPIPKVTDSGTKVTDSNTTFNG